MVAVLLQTGLAGGAGAAAVYHATDARQLTHLEALDLTTDRGDPPDDLVSGNKRIGDPAPLIARRMDIRVTDAAEQNIENDILGPWVATLEREQL